MRSAPLSVAQTNTLRDAAELRRERETKRIDRSYRMAASFEEWRRAEPVLVASGLVAPDGAITDAGRVALAGASR